MCGANLFFLNEVTVSLIYNDAVQKIANSCVGKKNILLCGELPFIGNTCFFVPVCIHFSAKYHVHELECSQPKINSLVYILGKSLTSVLKMS